MPAAGGSAPVSSHVHLRRLSLVSDSGSQKVQHRFIFDSLAKPGFTQAGAAARAWRASAAAATWRARCRAA
eukprot:2650392-Prymnesium_polylepis.1